MKVYYSDISCLCFDNVKYDNFCHERKNYVDSISDEKRKLQSIAVWKLLEYVTYGKTLNFSFAENGEWCDKNGNVCFSISHSHNIVAVAISDFAVGVDVEKCNEKITRIKRRFDFTLDDKLSLVENLTKQWTIEECVFKSKNAKNVQSKKIKDKLNNEYYISVCGEDYEFEFLPILTENFI